jgi:hypothetical protein
MRYGILLICILGSYAIFVMPAAAAILKIENDFRTLRVGDVFSVDVVVDTERQTINALETGIVFPRELLEYVESDEGESVFSLWIKKPNYNGFDKISFSGIVPGGFVSEKAALVTLRFRVIKIGQATIESADPTVLLHDGLGTAASVIPQNVHISIVEGTPNLTVYTVDDEKPESFTPLLVQDPDLFNGQPVLIFATADKGSGVDYFAVKEGRFGRYHQIESPYEIIHQALDTQIYIKAVDKMGNEQIEIFYPQNWQPWYKNWQIIVTILVLCVLLLFISISFLRRLSL